MRILLNNKFSILFLLSIFTFISCSKDGDDPQETTVTVSATAFSTTMDENPSNGQVIGTVQGGTNQGSVNFSITEQNPAGAFSIDSASGELKVANAALFDFETNPIITGTVKVANGSVSQNALVTVTLNDVNEESIYEGDVYLRTQEEVNIFGAKNYTHITGLLSIGDPDEIGSSNISDLSPLHNLNRVDQHVQFAKNPILSSSAGLNIDYVGGQIAFLENPLLESIEGFNDVTSINDLYLSKNNKLSNLSGLDHITSIELNISITQCPLIPNLDWLSNLRTAGNGLIIGSCHSLRNLDGLNNLSSLRDETGSIMITNNDALENLNGLQNLNVNLSTLYIVDNPLLQNISGLEKIDVFQTLSIVNNNLLQSLHGLEKITRNFSIISISNNDSLVDFQGLDNLAYTYGEFNVRYNGSLTNLNGLNGLLGVWQIEFIDNSNLSDYCALQNVFTIDISSGYTATGNAYNPTKQDIVDGNCSL